MTQANQPSTVQIHPGQLDRLGSVVQLSGCGMPRLFWKCVMGPYKVPKLDQLSEASLQQSSKDSPSDYMLRYCHGTLEGSWRKV